MIAVVYPQTKFRLKKEGEQQFIYDAIRKTWLLLTEEEWVRQNFVNYLVTGLGYPSTVIALEKEIRLNELRKRFDILVYDSEHRPWMLVECKGSEIPLNEEVLQQVLRYNVSVPVNFIVITNGRNTIGWMKADTGLQELESLPGWNHT